MDKNYQKIDEDILGITSYEEWKTLMHILEAEGAAATQNQLNAEDWDTVNYQRGYLDGLRFVANIRETTKMLIKQAETNAAL